MNAIRDGRDKHWFWIDDAVIDAHAQALGAFGLALYMVLARHADEGGDGEISRETIQEVFGWASTGAVWQRRDLLVRRGLIRQHGPGGDVLRYTLRACPSAPEAEEGPP